MKKILVLFLVVLLIGSMVACGQDAPKETLGGNIQDPVPTTDVVEIIGTTETETDAPVDLDNWGVEDSLATVGGGTKIDAYCIRLPRYTGSTYCYSNISEQQDDTVVLISGEYFDMPSVEKTADVFATYMPFTIESLEDMYGVRSSNFKMSIESSEAVTVGDYEMYVHTGVITYDFDGTERIHQYVAYATKLKDSGNGAYWMVYDISKDQSKGELIAQHALNMAKTLREEK